MLTNSLTNEFKDTNISQEEELVLETFIANLGLAARVSDEAFEFVANAIYPSFWQNHRGWRTENEKYKNELMAGAAVKALGYSGRTKGVRIIRQIIISDEYIPRFSGRIEGAAFQYYLISKYGDDTLTEYLGFQKGYPAYLEWKAEYAEQWMEKLGLPYEE